MSNEREDDREFFKKHGTGGAGHESIGWYDSVLEFEDYHGEAEEVCNPFVENTGFTIEDIPTGLGGGWPPSWNLNFYPQNSRAMLGRLRNARAPSSSKSGGAQKKAAKQAAKEEKQMKAKNKWFSDKGGAAATADASALSGLTEEKKEDEAPGLMVGVETSWENWVVSAQGSTADGGIGKGHLVSIDHTDWTVPGTDERCQIDARAIWSTAADGGPMEGANEIFEGKLQCDNWAIKAEFHRPEDEGVTIESSGVRDYALTSVRESNINANINSSGFWKDWLKSVYTAGVYFDGNQNAVLGFRAWGLNWTREAEDDAPSGDWFAATGLAKATAALSFERNWDDDFEPCQTVKRFYDPSIGQYKASVSAELENGYLAGMQHSQEEGTTFGVRIPLPALPLWNSAQLRTRLHFGQPEDGDDADRTNMLGFALFWTTSRFSAEACLQLRHTKGVLTPRVYVKLQKADTGDDD